MEKQIVLETQDHRLHGMLHLPQGERKHPVAIICHGFISSKVGQHQLFVKTARELCRAGFAVVRFDYSGCGESTGEYKHVTPSQHVEETLRIIDYVSGHPELDSERIILLGHSLGGCVAATAAGSDKRIQKLILWSPVAQPLADIVGIVGQEIYEECLQKGVANYQGFELGKGFFDSLAQLNPLEKVKSFEDAVFIAHGSRDLETPLGNAALYGQALSERSRGVVNINVIDDADHTYNAPLWEQTVIGSTLEWLQTNTMQ